MNKILYLQSNEKIADSFVEEFAARGLGMTVVKSGEEALKIIESEKVLLLLLDINIPDMRFRKLVDRVREISPQVIINVCIDVLDPLMITKLSNRHHVHKIYAAPWDIDTIIEEVKESIEVAVINEQSNVREEKINSEIKEIETTLEGLKSTLKKQQHSYQKLTTLLDCFTDALKEDGVIERAREEKIALATELHGAILKMQTTGSFDIDKFEDTIRMDIQELNKEYGNISVGEIDSCLFGDQSRGYAQNIRFCIYLVAKIFAMFYESCTINVSSHYITTREVEISIAIDASSDVKKDMADKWDEYREYMENIIGTMATNSRVSEEGNKRTYYCSFPVA